MLKTFSSFGINWIALFNEMNVYFSYLNTKQLLSFGNFSKNNQPEVEIAFRFLVCVKCNIKQPLCRPKINSYIQI